MGPKYTTISLMGVNHGGTGGGVIWGKSVYKNVAGFGDKIPSLFTSMVSNLPYLRENLLTDS
jgi:hypothetical protein